MLQKCKQIINVLECNIFTVTCHALQVAAIIKPDFLDWILEYSVTSTSHPFIQDKFQML